MRNLINLRSLFAAALVTGGLALSGTAAEAGHCYHSPCYYKTVISYEYETIPYTVLVTKHHPCGTPYTVQITKFRTIKVPVKNLVKVCY